LFAEFLVKVVKTERIPFSEPGDDSAVPAEMGAVTGASANANATNNNPTGNQIK